jgi:hypothetical protein
MKEGTKVIKSNKRLDSEQKPEQDHRLNDSHTVRGDDIQNDWPFR